VPLVAHPLPFINSAIIVQHDSFAISRPVDEDAFEDGVVKDLDSKVLVESELFVVKLV